MWAHLLLAQRTDMGGRNKGKWGKPRRCVARTRQTKVVSRSRCFYLFNDTTDPLFLCFHHHRRPLEKPLHLCHTHANPPPPFHQRMRRVECGASPPRPNTGFGAPP